MGARTSTLRRVLSTAIVAIGFAGVETASAAICDVSAFSCPATGTCVVNGAWLVGDVCVLDFGDRAVELKGTLEAETTGGSFDVRARELTLTGGKLKSQGDSDDPGGYILIEVAETFRMQGTGPRLDVAGDGGGGVIYVIARSMDLESGTMTADGGSSASCGDAGFVILEAIATGPGGIERGPIAMGANLTSKTAGQDCRGGLISVAGESVTVTGELDARGGAGADEDAILVAASTGDVVVTSSAGLQADGTGQPGGSGAWGGAIVLSAGGNVSLAATPLSATGKAPDGVGGVLFIYAGGDIAVSSNVSLSGSGSAGVGGEMALFAYGSAILTGDVHATGGTSLDGEGGSVLLDGDAGASVTSLVDVSGGNGGAIELNSFEQLGPVTIGGTLRARGVRGFGGLIFGFGCSVTVSGTLDANAPLGGEAQGIELSGATIAVTNSATLGADPCPVGTSCITMETDGTPPSIATGAVVSPAPTFLVDVNLPGC